MTILTIVTIVTHTTFPYFPFTSTDLTFELTNFDLMMIESLIDLFLQIRHIVLTIFEELTILFSCNDLNHLCFK